MVRPVRRTFVERHSTRVGATPEAALAAAREVTLAQLPVARVLFALRGLPRRGGTIVESLLGAGFRIAEDAPTRLVVEARGTPWTLRGGLGDERGALMTLALWAEPGRLITETRVECPDDASARAFRRYWLVVRPFSGLIRRLWLRAAASRLAASGRPSAR